jgi:hypothetical protein
MVHKLFTLNTDSNVYYLPSKVGRVIVHGAMHGLMLPDRLYAHIVFKAWTPGEYIFRNTMLPYLIYLYLVTGAVVADVYIAASDGTRLCTLTQVEVERHENSPSTDISTRYDLVFQPLEIPFTTVEERDITLVEPEDTRQLYVHLDYLASQAISATLSKQFVTGEKVDLYTLVNFSYLLCL